MTASLESGLLLFPLGSTPADENEDDNKVEWEVRLNSFGLLWFRVEKKPANTTDCNLLTENGVSKLILICSPK